MGAMKVFNLATGLWEYVSGTPAISFPQHVARNRKVTSTTVVATNVILSAQVVSPVVGAVYRSWAVLNMSNNTAAATAAIGLWAHSSAAAGGTQLSETVFTFVTANRRYPGSLDGYFTYASGALYMNMIVNSTSGGTLTDSGALSPISLYVERVA